MMEPGEDYGATNMGEFWNNIWTVEEGRAMAAAMIGNVDTDSDSQKKLQEASVKRPRTLTRKTVDQVWKEIQRQNRQQEHEEQEQKKQQQGRQQRQQWAGGEGEMTLEDFLVKTGVIRDDTGVDTTAKNGTVTSFASTFGGQTPQVKVESIMENQQQLEWYNYQLNQQQQQQFLLQQQQQQEQAEAAAATITGLAKRTDPVEGILLPGNIDNMLEAPINIGPGLIRENLSTKRSLYPGLASSAGPDTPTKRRVYDVGDSAVERRQLRMTKNRESASRSRARKQAYTMELEAEVIQLKQELAQLKRQQVCVTCLQLIFGGKIYQLSSCYNRYSELQFVSKILQHLSSNKWAVG
ncbi:hypothetical protein O6H91_10G017300 [Diphasiastrum complanatum]|uniref:Uncharacterized protein n=1 Tax=Diphasiastrum complanatum TaxID=34168 RepID=A0ACC2CES0_DIPCM|nr:hypothetical protein O6H91_Y066900 [Diphasiastrum complanatum]KAJ7540484.1 hypothetical protein O6H91_10G017300 [Diphasiastrum complanatum]